MYKRNRFTASSRYNNRTSSNCSKRKIINYLKCPTPTIGATGPTGPAATTFGQFYRSTATGVLAANAIIPLLTTGPNTTADLVLTGTGGVQVNTAGLYSVSYMASAEDDLSASQVSFALNINGGAALPVSTMTTTIFTSVSFRKQPRSNTVLLRFAAGDVLTLIVTSASANQFFNGPNAASITLVKIAD
ncbi:MULTISPECIES: hypothetical protein [Clostridia]|uniref:hypothetical protein n=1 Tax=Clostridia TaxID=186801 RepID=UPI000EA142A0|nr:MULTISPECIES: hypothetical protein [Clostridia]NBJ71552.1 hypothetical protein [Roseburia sp. 1XD42-34]RKI74198.1 hypothetical protein D7V87_19245 [Clostridium sp. 1xD42-85]